MTAAKLALLKETQLVHASTAGTGILEIYARATVVGRVSSSIARGVVAFAHFHEEGSA